MPIKKKLTLGLSLLILASTALADTYTIQKGDTIDSIAKHFKLDRSQLLEANDLTAGSALKVGSQFTIPNSSTVYKDKTGRSNVPAQNTSAETGNPLVVLNALDVNMVSSRHAVVNGNGVAIRSKPDASGTVLLLVGSGTTVEVTERSDSGEWCKLALPSGRQGWIRGDYLTVKGPDGKQIPLVAKAPAKKAATKAPAKVATATKTSAPAANKGNVATVLSRARSMRGVRYVWGAASRSAVDCSGFTTQIFKAAGINLPRTSAAQSQAGVFVARKNLQPGDLVFFRTTRGSRVSHVGVYTGNNKFMHASSGRGHVMESSLGETYYNSRYVTARRVIKAQAQIKKALHELEVSLDPITDPTSEEFSR